MRHKLSVIILSYTYSEEIYRMNCRALDSLYASENWKDGELEVRIIESNKANPYSYDLIDRGGVIIPQEPFNFHRFFNIGLDHTDGDFIAFCNNDILFEKGWWSAICEVKNQHPEFMCFSPIDDKYKGMCAESLPREKDFYCGWDYGKYFAMWCFVWERKVFDIIGRFDETFDFYAADADETNTLRKNAIYSVVCTKSVVRHISSQTAKETRKTDKHKITDYAKYPLTEQELKHGYAWLWDDDRYYWGYKHETDKWGNIQMTKRIQRMIICFPILNKRWLTRILYSKKVNLLLCKLTGIKL